MGGNVISPGDLGLERLDPQEIRGGDSVEQSAGIFIDVLEGNGTMAQSHVVCANAGMAIAVADGVSHETGFERARESLASGKALKALKTLLELNK